MRNPFYEGLRPDWLFTIVELEPVLPRLEELQRKTLERLRLSGGTIERVTFFRHSIFYPKNRKLLVEVRVENPSQENGRVVFDLQGAVVDVVGGPSSEDSGGTKAVGLTDVTPERVSAFETLAVSHEDLLKKYHDALWGKTWASAPAKLFKLPRSDFQQWAACQRDLLANVEKILNVYAEKKPPSDEIGLHAPRFPHAPAAVLGSGAPVLGRILPADEAFRYELDGMDHQGLSRGGEPKAVASGNRAAGGRAGCRPKAYQRA